jgi:hypothetical protein
VALTGSNQISKLAKNCNKLAQRLQSERGYKVSWSDQQIVLQPFAAIWQEQSPTTLDDLLDAGLSDEAAAYLVGWLALERQ